MKKIDFSENTNTSASDNKFFFLGLHNQDIRRISTLSVMRFI